MLTMSELDLYVSIEMDIKNNVEWEKKQVTKCYIQDKAVYEIFLNIQNNILFMISHMQ